MPSFKTSPYPLERFYPAITDANETYGTDPNAVDLNRMPTLRQLAAEDAMNGSQGYNPMQQATWNNQANQFIQQQDAQEQENTVMSQLGKLDTQSAGGKQALDMLLRFNPEAAASPRLRNYLSMQTALARPEKGTIPTGVAEAMNKFRAIDYRNPDAIDKAYEINRTIDAETAAHPEVIKARSDAMGLAQNFSQREQARLVKEEDIKAKKAERSRLPKEAADELIQDKLALANIRERFTPEEAGKEGGFKEGPIPLMRGTANEAQIEAGYAKLLQKEQARLEAKENLFRNYYGASGTSTQPDSYGNQPPTPIGTPAANPSNQRDPYFNQPTAPVGAVQPTEGTPETVVPPQVSVSVKPVINPSISTPAAVDTTPTKDMLERQRIAGLTGFEKMTAQQAYETDKAARDKEMKNRDESLSKKKYEPVWEAAKNELLNNFTPNMFDDVNPEYLVNALGKDPNEVAFQSEGRDVKWFEVVRALKNDNRFIEARKKHFENKESIIPEFKFGNITLFKKK